MFSKRILSLLSLVLCCWIFGQNETEKVNVFLGTSGDHGQMSPAASYPFGILSIGPQTYPTIHAGYEFKAKKFLGFTHTRMEGVGCMGSGGNFLLKPILNENLETELIKKSDDAKPGFYEVNFENGIDVKTAVANNFGRYKIDFPANSKPGFLLDLSFAFVNRFQNAKYTIENNRIFGYSDTKSTCDKGSYRVYFCFQFPEKSTIKELSSNKLIISVPETNCLVNVAVSSVNEDYAKNKISNLPFEKIKEASNQRWNELLGRVKVQGNIEDEKLFYSLLYRTLQSPFIISEADGSYRATDGSLQKTNYTMYHGWAIWDNFRDQLPLFSILYPEIYKDIANSLANMYPFGKTQWATDHSPSITVRTEHTVGVLLDAVNKNIKIPLLPKISDKIKADVDSWELNSPDKMIESSYDYWAASQIFEKIGKKDWAKEYLQKSKNYREIWLKEFKDVTKQDVDKMGARGMYQGTVWQYRWLIPHDVAGLKNLVGGDQKFISELDTFFNKDFYNHANETDTQAPSLYNATPEPWKSQRLMHKLLLEEVVQFYFNDNSKGIDSFIGRIYKNQPDAYIRTMDDDAGAMSAWWVMRSLGFSTVNVGEPYFYLNAPIFNKYILKKANGKELVVNSNIQNSNFYYINGFKINHKLVNRNWITYDEIQNSTSFEFNLSDVPNKSFGTKEQKISSLGN